MRLLETLPISHGGVEDAADDNAIREHVEVVIAPFAG